jgi:hypothetical protein
VAIVTDDRVPAAPIELRAAAESIRGWPARIGPSCKTVDYMWSDQLGPQMVNALVYRGLVD